MWVLLPVKSFAEGKSRLASMLLPEQRAQLICFMLDDVLRALQAAREVKKILVLSNESRIDATLANVGVERLPEEPGAGSLNAALTAAANAMAEQTQSVLILPSDVPTVCPRDIEALSQSRTSGIVLCPAETDGGTNALLSPLPLPIPLQFGDRSVAAHLRSARLRSVASQVIARPGLGRDMDRWEDLVWLAGSSHRGRTYSYLRRLGVGSRQHLKMHGST